MTKVTLYYADWCGHCKDFKPTWAALKNLFKKNNVNHAEFEDGQHEQIIQKAGVEGFPTIKIEKDNEEYEYTGNRDINSIIHEVLPDLQMGGGNLTRYNIVYNKV
jgi:protein disulfide-isomerase A1